MAVAVLIKSEFGFAESVAATASGQHRNPQAELFLKLLALLIGKMCSTLMLSLSTIAPASIWQQAEANVSNATLFQM